MSEDILLEPVKAYTSTYKQAVNDEAGVYFDALVEKSGIDVEANRQTIKDIKKKEAELKDVKKQISKLKAGKTALIFGIIVFFVMSLVCLFSWFYEDELMPLYVSIPLFIVGIGLGVFFIITISKNINPKIKNIEGIKAKIEEKIRELIELAKAQMAPLNALYDWNMATTIIEKVIPILDFDKYFDGSKYVKLVQDYGFDDLNDVNQSTLYVQSGTILGNPYLIQKARLHSIYDKAYTGSITISWTEYYYDSKGNRCSRLRTQVLTATTYHPAPMYTNEVALIYGNNAAPDLTFSRKPNGLGEKPQKQIDKYVRSHTDDLYKKAEKSLSSGSKHVFTPLANTEFELLLDALDRDHDVQFRLLYTPLAQRNTMNLLKSKEGYGDDFYFYKRKKINIISSKHSQGEDLSGSPHIFIGYDHDVARQRFIDYVNNFFKVIYFDFAPLLSIPLYQQMKSIDYIYGDDAPSNYSTYEHEVFSNSFDESLLKHPESITPCILKTHMIGKEGKSDKFNVTAYSYRGEDRVDYVTKMGGDGNLHTIPVYWVEYIPIEQTSTIELRNTNASRNEFNNKLNEGPLANFISRNSMGGYYSFQRGLVAMLSGGYSLEGDKELDSIFDKKDE